MILILDITLSIFLFFAVNWLGRHSLAFGYLQLSIYPGRDEAPAFNFLLKTLAPTVFIILVSTIFYVARLDNLIQQIWLVAPYYFLLRIAYNILFGRILLLNWPALVIQFMVGTGAASLAYTYLILPRSPLLPGAASIGEQLWIILALFFYAAFNSVRTSNTGSIHRKNKYLRSRFAALKGRYGSLIEGQFPERYMELVAYAILIYETFNRPWLARSIERAVFPWGSHTIGPMQVRSNVWLPEPDSVAVGIQELKNCFATTKEEIKEKRMLRYHMIRSALAKYNRDETYISEVSEVLRILWAQIATDYRTEFENMYNEI